MTPFHGAPWSGVRGAEVGTGRPGRYPLSRSALAERIEHLRTALEPDAATVGGIPAFDGDAAWTLYRDLLHPARRVLDGAARLVVVNHAIMGQLPLAVLPIEKPDPAVDDELLFAGYRKVPWLAQRWSTAVVPSEASFIAGRSVPASPRTRRELVAFGDPAFASGQAESLQEALEVAHETRGLRLRRRSTLLRASPVWAPFFVVGGSGN